MELAQARGGAARFDPDPYAGVRSARLRAVIETLLYTGELALLDGLWARGPLTAGRARDLVRAGDASAAELRAGLEANKAAIRQSYAAAGLPAPADLLAPVERRVRAVEAAVAAGRRMIPRWRAEAS